MHVKIKKKKEYVNRYSFIPDWYTFFKREKGNFYMHIQSLYPIDTLLYQLDTLLYYIDTLFKKKKEGEPIDAYTVFIPI